MCYGCLQDLSLFLSINRKMHTEHCECACKEINWFSGESNLASEVSVPASVTDNTGKS